MISHNTPLHYDLENQLMFFNIPGQERRRVNWNKIEDIQLVIKLWADDHFPKRTAHQALCKLVLEEIPEMLRDLDSPGEYADLLILIFDIASLRGINIAHALEDKMKLNMQRDWIIDNETGIAHHV